MARETAGFLPYRLRIRAIEAFSATLAIYWGVLLLLPAKTFSMSPSYRIMAALAEEETWGAIYLSMGVVQWFSVFIRSHLVRPVAIHMAIFCWGFAALMFAISNPYTHAPGIYGLLALANIIGALWCRT